MRLKLIGILLLFTVEEICSQSNDMLRPDILPKSPEAGAFAKNVNIPISYTSGTPQIGIPLASMRSGSIEVPITLSYNASGIRVEEVPTWVGLGWNLNAGGQITRTVRMLPDETANVGFYNVPNDRKIRYVAEHFCWCSSSSDPYEMEVSTEARDLEIDLEPDIYTFSVLGYSGEFFYNQDSGRHILMPFQNIKIESYTTGIILVLPNGVKAYFGNSSSSVETLQSGTTTSYVDGISYASVGMGNTPYATSWMLTELIDPRGRKINFKYQLEYIITFGRGGERVGPSFLDATDRQSFYEQVISRPLLTSIESETGNIYFKKSSSDRLDMPGAGTSYASRSLDTLVVTTTANTELKSYYFRYGYFVSPDYNPAGILGVDKYDTVAERRLYLKTITEKAGVDSLPPYVFTYNPLDLPSRFSTSQDYWGYYNGKSNSTRLMPRIPSLPFFGNVPNYAEANQILPDYGGYQYLYGTPADRRIDSNYTQARLLTTIKYPTGGTTEYKYEQNQASVDYLNIYGGMEPPDAVYKSYSFDHTKVLIPSQAPYPLYFKGSFKIEVPTTKVKMIPQMATCTTYQDAACKMLFKIRRRSDSALLYTRDQTSVFQAQLEKGEYLVEILIDGSTDDYPLFFDIDFEWGERLDSINYLIGGARVKQIISSDSLGRTITKSLRYLIDSTAESSGIANGSPTFKTWEPVGGLSSGIYRQFYSSNSVVPITDGGSTVRYTYVSEYLDSSYSSFRTDYQFTSSPHQHFNFAQARTGMPLISRPWRNNHLKKKTVYEKHNGFFRKVLEEETTFLTYVLFEDMCGLYGAQSLPYNLASDWVLPDSTYVTQYSYQSGSPLEFSTKSRQLYNSRYLPSETQSLNSKGQTLISKTWYPSDFNNVSGFNITHLLNRYIINVPIKQENTINGKIKSGSVIKYSPIGLPIEGYAYENQQMATQPSHDPNTILTSSHILKTTLSYNIDANLTQITSASAGPEVYVWDYDINGYTGRKMNELPIGVAKNADSTSVAYTSFERYSTGGWMVPYTSITSSTAIMGTKVYSLSSGMITKSGLSSTSNYVVSYWGSSQQTVSNTATTIVGRSARGMTYYEHKVVNPTSGTITISGSGTIDELRLHPEHAQMTTYDYNSRFQLAGQNDPSNKIIYYQYDPFGRLSLVRDIDSNILKKYCYNYAGQVENCGLGTEAHWQIVDTYCEKQNGINTGNQVKIKKDTNPLSSTYGSTSSTAIYNPTACYVCTTNNCTGNDKKCINNVCETGVKEYTGSTRLNSSTWRCFYRYRFSDNSTSDTYYEDRVVLIDGPCPL